MKYKFLIIMFLWLTCISAQDGYYGKRSNFVVNLSEPANTVFNFDYKMTGVIYSRTEGYPFTIHVNSGDGSWAITDNAVEELLGRSVVSRDYDEKFDFLIHIPNKVTRGYYTVLEDDGPKKVYSEIKRGLWASISQLEFMQEEKITRFLQDARVRNVRSHPNFGPQKSYEGVVSSGFGSTNLKLIISNNSARIKINPLHVGFLCGVFQDPTQKKNRFITHFETPEITVEMNSFTYEPFVLEAYEYTQRESTSEYNVESMDVNYSDIQSISERMLQLNQEMRGAIGDPDRVRIISLKIRIEGERFKAIKSGHPERYISDDVASKMVVLKGKIIEKEKECKRYRRDSSDERRCKVELKRLEEKFNDLIQEYF